MFMLCSERNIRPEPEIMNPGERRLVSLAAALIGDAAGLSRAEIKLVERAPPIDPYLVAHTCARIRAGQDPLGIEFCSLRSARQRRQRGATYTPAAIVDAMVAWAHAEISTPARVVDPGAGSGRFLIAAAHKFPAALPGRTLPALRISNPACAAPRRSFSHRASPRSRGLPCAASGPGSASDRADAVHRRAS